MDTPATQSVNQSGTTTSTHPDRRGGAFREASHQLIPVRMLNEYAYCPRLSYLMWVQGEFVDNKFTEEGRYVHRRVDAKQEKLPAPENDAAPKTTRSVLMSSDKEGLIARIDLVETIGKSATPVDYKRGKKPNLPEGAYEPERVQVCAQSLILKDNGFLVTEAILYFAGSKTRVTVPIDEELVQRTRSLVRQMRAMTKTGQIPPPLDDSPKCDGCSLAGICLPDEVNLLKKVTPAPHKSTDEPDTTPEHLIGLDTYSRLSAGSKDTDPPRRLYAMRPVTLPLYVHTQGLRIGKRQDRLIIRDRNTIIQEALLFNTSQICLFGNIQITTQALTEALAANIPVCFFSFGGWFRGIASGLGHKNIELRINQFEAAQNPEKRLQLAKSFVEGKILNCRTLLRRNMAEPDDDLLRRMRLAIISAQQAESEQTLLGIEGTAARLYFGAFNRMLRAPKDHMNCFDFNGRNRRPPRDPVNALLSLAYAILSKDLTVTAASVGLDPFLGYYHQPRYGRPALALDLMEEFRPIIADSVVLTAINTGVIKSEDFIRSGNSVALTGAGRTRFIKQYERRMDSLVTHPIFGYQVSYRQILELQVRLLSRFLMGEINEYPYFYTR